MPHPDAVPMVGPGWLGAPSATDPLEVGAVPPLSPHHGYRFSPVRRCGGCPGYFHSNRSCRLPPAPPIMKMGRSPGPRRNGRGFGILAPVDPLYPGEIAGEESGWGMNASDSSATLGMTFS